MGARYTKKRGVVAADHALSAEAGAEMLRLGGNAFDAAVAAAWMSFVANSTIASAGGGGYFLAAPESGDVHFFDFFVDTPNRRYPLTNPDFYPVSVNFGDKSQEFHIGLASVATPGNVAGLFEVHDRFGLLPMATVCAPAVEAARKGVEIDMQARYQMEILAPILTASEEGRSIYAPSGALLQIGERWSIPDFADCLEYISRHGPREFYEGEIAGRIVRDSEERGGHLRESDFQAYRIRDRSPLRTVYRKYDLYTPPPPAPGGLLLAFILRLLNHLLLSPSDYGTARHFDMLVNAMKLTETARQAHLSTQHSDADGLLSEKVMDKFRGLAAGWSGGVGNTVHISAADGDQNMALITTSAGEGCGYIVPGTGIMLNNMLGEEDLSPGGFHRWEPGMRMGSMMAPCMLSHRGRPVMGLGSAGSNRIRSAIAQSIMNYVDFALGFDEVVNAPRIHWERGHLDVEPGFDAGVIASLSRDPDEGLILWKEQNMYFGGVQAVFIDDEGGLHGAADRRRSGAVVQC